MADQQKRIMVGYNVFFTSERVIDVAIEHAVAFDAKLIVVSSVVGHSLDEEGALADRAPAERLTEFRAKLEKAAIPYETHLLVRELTPGEDLVAFAKENGIYEMVVGFKKRSAIGEIVFGSNYRHMIENAPCPIVTVHD